jgi:phage baseplate assembly protein W
MITESAISLPFSLNKFGKIATTSDQSKLWQDRVLSAIGTTVSERPMRVDYGTRIAYELFDTIEATEVHIRQEISDAFTKFLPALTLTDVVVTPNEKTGSISVDIEYSLPNNDQATTSIGVAYISGSNQLIEETVNG